MTVRSVVLVLLSLFAAIFLILNWAGITAPVPVNLLFKSTQAPLGLILLVVLGALWCVGIVWALMQQASTLVEIRRAYKEASANKNLAEHAEVSRIEQVKALMKEDLQAFENRLIEAVQKSETVTTQSGVDTETRLVALEKSVDRLEKTIAKMAEKLDVEPVEETLPAPAPKKSFFGFLSSSSEPKPEVKKEADQKEEKEKETSAA